MLVYRLENMKDTIKVYWSPADFNMSTFPKDNSMIYYEPENLLSLLYNSRSYLPEDQYKRNTMFSCPVFSNMSKNIFVLENPLKTSIRFENGSIHYDSDSAIPSLVVHPPSLNNQILFVYNMKWVFFTEEDSLSMKLTSPYFSKTPHSNYGSLVPGKLDIGKWFRNITLEYNLWEGVDKFSIDQGEHLAYVEFDTEKRVELVRFKLNTELKTYLESSASSSIWEPRIKIAQRYDRFKRSGMKNLVMKEILSNIVDKKYN
jgi:hypothetical protein